MNLTEHIEAYIELQPPAKQEDMKVLHNAIVQMMPEGKLWYLDGKNSEGKTVSNPNIGYGSQTMRYADGTSREFYQIGLSANTGGISVYIMGIEDKTYLAKTYGQSIGKASITGYCIKFKNLKDIDKAVLIKAIRFGLQKEQ